MSVINQMLKDLDQRQSGRQRPQPKTYAALAAPRRSWRWLVLVFGGAIVLLYWLWPASSQNQSIAQAALPATLLPQTVLPETEPQPRFVSQPQAVASAIEAEPLPEERIQSEPELSRTAAAVSLLPLEPESTPFIEPGQQPGQSADVAMPAERKPELKVERVQLSAEEQQQRLRQQAMQAEQAARPDEARAYWQQLQALAPKQPASYIALARMAQQAGHEAGSQYWLQLGLEQGADISQLAPALAASYARQQLWPQVLSVLELMPESAFLPAELALRATAWQQLGQHQAALATFERLALLEPQQGRWWLGMAISSDALGQSRQAIEQFQRSLQLGDDLNPTSRDYIRQRLQELN